MTRLTKDQRREQKKQKERKQALQREQAANRKLKTIAPALSTIHAALVGFVERDDLESAFLTLFKGIPAVSLPAPFDAKVWKELQEHTQALLFHSILHGYDTDSAEDSTLPGRAYFFDEDSSAKVREHFPVAAVLASQWTISRVVQELSKEVMGKVTPGAYVFGVPFGIHGVNFAVVTSKENPEEAAYYLVRPDDWRRMDTAMCDDALGSIIVDAYRLNEDDGAQHNDDFRLIEVLTNEADSETEAEPKPLTPLMRRAIMTGGSGLVNQVDLLVDAIRDIEEEQEALGETDPDQDYEDGFRDGQRERDELLAQLKAAEDQLKALKRQASTGPKVAPESARALSLSERMGLLLAPLH